MKTIKLLLSFTILISLTSCFLFKHKTVERHKVEAVRTIEKDSLSLSFKDSAFKKETITINEDVIEVEIDTVSTETDTLRVPVNGDDYFPIPIKGRVKKVTVRSSQTANKKESGDKKETSIVQTKRKDTSNVKVDSYRKEKEVKRFNILPLIIVAVAGALLILFILWVRRKKKELDEVLK